MVNGGYQRNSNNNNISLEAKNFLQERACIVVIKEMVLIKEDNGMDYTYEIKMNLHVNLQQ